jgi:hypothetical protein
MRHYPLTETTEDAFASAYAGKAWVAEITGPDPKFGLTRRFLPKRDETAARSNTYRDLVWTLPLTEGACYEYFVQVTSGQQERGFWLVRGGALVAVERADVLRRFAATSAA